MFYKNFAYIFRLKLIYIKKRISRLVKAEKKNDTFLVFSFCVPVIGNDLQKIVI